MVSTSLRDALGSVASAFRERGRQSPFHVQVGIHGQGSIHPRLKAILKGIESTDPLPQRQKALTPAFLVDLHKYAQVSEGKGEEHTADLIRGAYFFAMRACEFCRTESAGRTKRLKLENITFRGEKNEVVEYDDPDLETKANFVTICFVDQKNGNRMEKRSQRRSGVPILCPIEAWAAVVKRHRRDFPGERGKKVTICSYRKEGSMFEVTAAQVTKLLRKVCLQNDGLRKYGYSQEEIGTRSIRSGAAMSLAVQGGHTDEKIRILGRWKSLAFLTYIRPQVLEWSGGMAADMAKTKSFTDVSEKTKKGTDQKAPATRQPSSPPNQAIEQFPRFGKFDLG
jgi:hypothetical protein